MINIIIFFLTNIYYFFPDIIFFRTAELKHIEDTILRLLDAAEGNILDDDELISTLSASRVTSVKIQDKVSVSERVKKNIDAKRKVYVQYL